MTEEKVYFPKSNLIKFLKIREVKSPSRAYEFDAGIDFYVPEFTESFLDDLAEKNSGRDLSMVDGDIVIPPHSRIMIPAGLKLRMKEPGRALVAANKSGVATKTGLIYGAQVIDYTYKGEIHISLINTTDNNVTIKAGQKVIQFLEIPVYTSKVEVINKDDENTESLFYSGMQDDRGAGGFGSTDKK